MILKGGHCVRFTTNGRWMKLVSDLGMQEGEEGRCFVFRARVRERTNATETGKGKRENSFSGYSLC